MHNMADLDNIRKATDDFNKAINRPVILESDWDYEPIRPIDVIFNWIALILAAGILLKVIYSAILFKSSSDSPC